MVRVDKITPKRLLSLLTVYFFLPACLFMLPVDGSAQQTGVKRRVEILHSDSMRFDRTRGRSSNRLNGNVSLKHNDLFMNCDSAWYYDDTNQVFAFSRIHIWQGDTINIWGSILPIRRLGQGMITEGLCLPTMKCGLY